MRLPSSLREPFGRLPRVPEVRTLVERHRVTTRADGRSAVWRSLVPVAALAAGVLFAVSAHTARGTDLRASSTSNLVDLVRAAERKVDSQATTAASLNRSVQAQTALAGTQNSAVAAAQASASPLRLPAGLVAVSGPGLTVTLSDADPSTVPAGVTGEVENQYVVHQSDVQAVVNALWTGGAEAMTIAGQRIVATSAVRCVGNTLLLNGQVFSPPFRVQAIGPQGTMQRALAGSPGVTVFVQAAGYYGLHYTVEQDSTVQLPAYDGPIGLSYAKAVTR